MNDVNLASGAEQIDLLVERAPVALPFGLLAFFNGFAKRAGMLTVERLSQRFLQRRGLGEIHSHADPGHRLQEHPMAAHRQHEHGGDTELKDASNHAGGQSMKSAVGTSGIKALFSPG
jgi:hypothetical protein